MKTSSVLALAALFSVVALRSPPAAAADSANDCVRMHEGPGGEGLVLSIDNTCDRRLFCSLSWTLQCESASGRVTRRTKESARMSVAASGAGTTTASAKACGDNWRIDEVSWECASSK